MLILRTSKLVEIFVETDDFVKNLEKSPIYAEIFGHLPVGSAMSKSELMTICIYYHYSGMRCFKWYYENIILDRMRSYFPQAYSYSHFVNSMRLVYRDLVAYLLLCRLGQPSKANYVDSKKLEVCHIKREKQHKVFAGLASKGKSSTGWFFGLKLHVVVNQWGELLRIKITGGNVADNNANLLQNLLKGLQGWLFADRGYWSKIREDLAKCGLDLIPKPKKKQEGLPINAEQKHYAGKRGVIESVFEHLTHTMDIDHTRHRSPKNAFVNLFAGLIGYTFLDHKPHTDLVNPKDYQKIVLI
jgi:Transposase DDE domain